MKTLVVYYSRTGTTKKVGEEIVKVLNCDSEEVIDLKKRKGAIGWLVAGKDASLKRLTKIKDIERAVSSYDLVLIGTPVWAGKMACAVRTYISQNKEKLKNVAFFCTQGSSGGKETFEDMKELCNKEPIAVLELLTKDVVKGEYINKIKDFSENILNKK